MIAVLASTDLVTWISIFVKTMIYATTLIAAGGVLLLSGLQELTGDGRRVLRRMVAIGGLSAAVLGLLQLPLQASFLMGGSLAGAGDPMMLEIVAKSPLGSSIVVHLIGLALILTVFLNSRGARWLAIAGALLTCASFALRGHALGDPRLLLGPLVTVHLAALAFWIAAFVPLSRATRHDTPAQAGALAHEFGTKAIWIVAALMAAGAATLVLLGAATPDAVATPYGQAFLIKLGLFVAVLGLAALNKVRLTPDLRAARPGAAMRLRRSITLETALVLAILVITATLTTLTSPATAQANGVPQPPATVHAAADLTGDPQW